MKNQTEPGSVEARGGRLGRGLAQHRGVGNHLIEKTNERVPFRLRERTNQAGHQLKVAGQHPVEELFRLGRQADAHHAAIMGVALARHETIALKRINQPRHGRTGHAGRLGQLRRRARARRKALPADRVRAALPRVEEQHQHTETALRNAVGVEILFREGKGLVARPQEMQKHFTRGGVQIGKGLRRTQQALVAGKVFQHQEWHGPKGLGVIQNIRKLIIRRLIIETSDLCRFRGEKIPNPSFK